MRFNIINALIASVIVGLLGWWLWMMGIEPVQKWLLAFVGGFVMEIGLLGGMACMFDNERSGMQVRVLMMIMTVVVFIASIIYSFFRWAPESYCIPIGLFCLICCYTGYKIYMTKE